MLHPRIESAFNLSGQPQMASDKRKFRNRHWGICSFNLQPYTPNPAPFLRSFTAHSGTGAALNCFGVALF